MKICVIMSAYNGMQYIEKQLDSIFSQEVVGDLTVYVRDDGSTDNTAEFLKTYPEYKTGRVSVERGKNIGASASFWAAIQNAPDADIYAFCDQDDVWLQGKVNTALKAICNCEKDMPVLWISNYNVVDSELNVLIKAPIKTPVSDSLYALFYNNIPGCVMVFNKELLFQMRKMQLEQIRMHDIMALNLALISGKVIFDSTPYIMYRQHGSNVIGYGHKKIKPIKWIREKIYLLVHKEPYNISEYAEQILINYADQLNEDDKAEYELIRDYKKAFWKRIKLLNKYYTKADISRTSVSIRCKIFFGLM